MFEGVRADPVELLAILTCVVWLVQSVCFSEFLEKHSKGACLEVRVVADLVVKWWEKVAINEELAEGLDVVGYFLGKEWGKHLDVNYFGLEVFVGELAAALV